MGQLIMPDGAIDRENWQTYDAEADVLYIDFHNPPKSSNDSELMDDDIVIRYNDREEIVGLTILHASQRTDQTWLTRPTIDSPNK